MAQLFETLCMMLAFKESHSLAMHYCRLVWDVRSLSKKLLQAAKAVSAAVFRLLFSRSDSLVETFHESVNVDAVCQGTLLDVLKMSSSAAEAAHAGIHEYLYGIRIFLNDFHDAHVFCDCHDDKPPSQSVIR